jgi:hypothetical protein
MSQELNEPTPEETIHRHVQAITKHFSDLGLESTLLQLPMAIFDLLQQGKAEFDRMKAGEVDAKGITKARKYLHDHIIPEIAGKFILLEPRAFIVARLTQVQNRSKIKLVVARIHYSAIGVVQFSHLRSNDTKLLNPDERAGSAIVQTVSTVSSQDIEKTRTREFCTIVSSFFETHVLFDGTISDMAFKPKCLGVDEMYARVQIVTASRLIKSGKTSVHSAFHKSRVAIKDCIDRCETVIVYGTVDTRVFITVIDHISYDKFHKLFGNENSEKFAITYSLKGPIAKNTERKLFLDECTYNENNIQQLIDRLHRNWEYANDKELLCSLDHLNNEHNNSTQITESAGRIALLDRIREDYDLSAKMPEFCGRGDLYLSVTGDNGTVVDQLFVELKTATATKIAGYYGIKLVHPHDPSYIGTIVVAVPIPEQLACNPSIEIAEHVYAHFVIPTCSSTGTIGIRPDDPCSTDLHVHFEENSDYIRIRAKFIDENLFPSDRMERVADPTGDWLRVKCVAYTGKELAELLKLCQDQQAGFRQSVEFSALVDAHRHKIQEKKRQKIEAVRNIRQRFYRECHKLIVKTLISA